MSCALSMYHLSENTKTGKILILLRTVLSWPLQVQQNRGKFDRDALVQLVERKPAAFPEHSLPEKLKELRFIGVKNNFRLLMQS